MVSVVSSVFKLQSRLLLLLLVVVVVAVLPEYLGNVRKAALNVSQLLYNVRPGLGPVTFNIFICYSLSN